MGSSAQCESLIKIVILKKTSKTDDEVRAFSSHFTYVQGYKTKTKKNDWAISKFVSLFIVQRKNRQQ